MSVTRALDLLAGQSEVWTAHEMDPANPQFNCAGYLDLTGPLRIDVFRRAALYLVGEECEALRRRPAPGDAGSGRPAGLVADEPPPLETIDLGDPDRARAELAARAWMEDDLTAPLRLDGDRLARTALLRLADDRHLFVLVEQRRGDRAMLDLSLMRNRTFVGLSIATFLSNATSLAAIFLEVSYLQNVLGYSPLGAGLRLLPLTLVLFVFAAVTGGVVTRFAPGLLIGTSILFIAIGMGLIALVGPGSSWLALLPSMIVIGMGMFNPPRSVVTVGVVEPAKAGMATGMGETFQQVGVAAFGALFQGTVLSAFSADGLARAAGDQTREIGRAIAAGAGNQLPAITPPGVSERIADVARTVFVDSLGNVMLVCAAVCALGAVVAYALIRGSDFHESAGAE